MTIKLTLPRDAQQHDDVLSTKSIHNTSSIWVLSITQPERNIGSLSREVPKCTFCGIVKERAFGTHALLQNAQQHDDALSTKSIHAQHVILVHNAAREEL